MIINSVHDIISALARENEFGGDPYVEVMCKLSSCHTPEEGLVGTTLTFSTMGAARIVAQAINRAVEIDNRAVLKAAAAKMVAEEPRTECDHAGILAERGM